MILRLCSLLSLRPLPALPALGGLLLAGLLLAGLLLAGSVGCYPHQGKPVDAPPDQLLALAHDACHRHDPDAWQMLLHRVAERHPDTPQAAHARRLLDEQSGSLAGCRRTLEAAEAHD